MFMQISIKHQRYDSRADVWTLGESLNINNISDRLLAYGDLGKLIMSMMIESPDDRPTFVQLSQYIQSNIILWPTISVDVNDRSKPDVHRAIALYLYHNYNNPDIFMICLVVSNIILRDRTFSIHHFSDIMKTLINTGETFILPEIIK